MEQILKGKTALVTGGSNGIGRAITMAFAQAGADVFFTFNRDIDSAKEVESAVARIGQKAYAHQAHFADNKTYSDVYKQAVRFSSQIDILVNNVGTLTRSRFLETTPEQYDMVAGVNLRTPFFLSQLFAKNLIQQSRSGAILNISSLSAHLARSGVAHYQSSKAGLNMLTKSLAFELGQYGIRVNTISPGLTATQANRDQWENQPDVWKERSRLTPLGRTGVPNDFGSAAVFLASEQASYITGTELIIDGGMSIV